MTEEAKAEVPQYTEVEQQALDEGWIPEERFDESSGKKFVSAEKYLENGSFFKKINEQKKEIDGLKKTVEQINAHNQKVAEAERKKLAKEYEGRIAQLEAQKIEALDEGDHAKVVQIDKELRDTDAPPLVNEEFLVALNNFKKNNDWYEKDDEMQDYADMIGLGYNTKHPDASPEKIFEHVIKETKARFPSKFENPARSQPPSVEGDTPPKPASKTISVKDLTKDEKEVFANFDRMGVFKTEADKKKYLSEVVEYR